MKLAPIVLFVYNRPWHTRQTLESLMKNELADESKLIIYADGLKEGTYAEDIQKTDEVRKVIREKQWCKSVMIIERKQNLGLAKSVITGVTEVVNMYGKVIVLEDDLVTSTGFLKYMNDALSIYENENNVYHISGYFFPIKLKINTSTFFYNQTSCWGWGTWKRAWKKLITNADQLLREINDLGLVDKFNIEGAFNFNEHLIFNINGTFNTWAVKWHATVFLNKGFSLHPKISLVKNVGFDGSGIHCGEDNGEMGRQSLVQHIRVIKIPVRENLTVRSQVISHFKKKNKSLIKWFDRLFQIKS